MINFRKRGLKHQKPQFERFQKYPMKCMKNAWKHEVKCKRKGIKDLPAYREENLAKNLEENDKKFVGKPCPIRRERKVWKPFWKVSLNKSNSDFKKTWFTIFDWSKISFDWSKQTEASFKNFKTISINQKTDWINRSRQRLP